MAILKSVVYSLLYQDRVVGSSIYTLHILVVLRLHSAMDDFPPGVIWPATDFDEVQIREVYSRYGLAMYMAQVLEHGMVNALVVMRTLPTMRSHDDAPSWHASFDNAYRTGLARTYGNMLQQLVSLERFPTKLLERLKAAKEDRDILAHRFFWQNDLAFLNRDGRTSMIAWCQARIELFTALSDDLDAFLAPIQAQYGITQERIDRVFEQSLEEARNWNPESEA